MDHIYTLQNIQLKYAEKEKDSLVYYWRTRKSLKWNSMYDVSSPNQSKIWNHPEQYNGDSN